MGEARRRERRGERIWIKLELVPLPLPYFATRPAGVTPEMVRDDRVRRAIREMFDAGMLEMDAAEHLNATDGFWRRRALWPIRWPSPEVRRELWAASQASLRLRAQGGEVIMPNLKFGQRSTFRWFTEGEG